MINSIRNWVLSRLDYSSCTNILIKGLWPIGCNFKPSIHERLFKYNIIVAQTLGQGSCYYDGDPIDNLFLSSLVGNMYMPINNYPSAVDISILDSIASSFCVVPQFTITLKGNCSEKAIKRAELLADEVDLISSTFSITNLIKVCNIGVVGLLIRELLNRGYVVTSSDMCPSIIGNLIHGEIPVLDNSHTNNLVRDSDIAVVTGMALSNNTLLEIIDIAINNSTKLIIFAQTGSHLAPFYLNMGVDIVFGEPFPFYTFDGTSLINVYRNVSL